MRYRYISLLMIVLVIGCAGTKETVTKAPEPEKTGAFDESFDPMSLNDDDIVIGPENNSTPAASTSGSIETAVTAKDPRKKEINGFRVQLLATSNIETASLSEQEATDRFEKLGHNTYLLFEAPLYKVRIGDCKTREMAETVRDLAIDNGYNGAFIVKTKIIVEE